MVHSPHFDCESAHVVPHLSDVIQAATGYALPLPLATFGLFVALGALAAGASFRAELKRFYEAGRIGPAYVNGLSRPPGKSSATLSSSY
jgi:phosphatidylglycerol:prolipoprotein diacylglycerol transferase